MSELGVVVYLLLQSLLVIFMAYGLWLMAYGLWLMDMYMDESITRSLIGEEGKLFANCFNLRKVA